MPQRLGMPEPDFTTADFHNVVHKQIVNAVYETLAAGKLEWELVAPFLETAREICGSEFRERAQVRLHTVRAEGDAWVDAEEAYLGIRVTGGEAASGGEEPADGEETEWLAETYWISDIALAERDPDKVRRVVAALERSIAKLNDWLAEQEKEGPAQTE